MYFFGFPGQISLNINKDAFSKFLLARKQVMVLSRSLSTFLFHYVYAMSAIFLVFQGPIYVFVFSYFFFSP